MWTPGEILCLASKPFPVDGLCTRPNDDNLSDESPLIPEIDCKQNLVARNFYFTNFGADFLVLF